MPADTHHRRGTFRRDRHARVQAAESVDPVILFRLPHLDECVSLADLSWPVWDRVRREAWSEMRVGCLPGGANYYDGLTQKGDESIRHVF